MARLIDADALKEAVEFHVTSMSVCLSMDEHYGKVTMREDCLTDIDNAPTIDAIPVEWLEEKMQKPQMTCANPFGYVLAEWLEEQEAR